MALYNHYTELNKDVLLQEEDFIDDASAFLIDRGGYTPDELSTEEKVYDAYMEHFRYQNVNEVTALKDLNYAQDSDDQSRARMGRLMDTFDKMDNDLGTEAALDYLGGVFTAPSTYAGMFSLGTGKAAALAANQGVKIGIRQALKYGTQSAAKAIAIDAPIAAGTVAAQEETRVQTGIKDEIDMTNVALAGGLSTVASGGIGLLTGTKRALSIGAAEEIAEQTTQKYVAKVEKGNKKAVKTLTNDKTSKVGKDFLKAVKTSLEEDIVKYAKTKDGKSRMLPLAETIPDELKAGEKIRLANVKSKGKTLEQMEIENIASAASMIDDKIGDLPGLPKGKSERFTSRLVRALAEAKPEEVVKYKSILNEHNLTFDQLGPLFAAEISRSASQLGTLSAAKRKQNFNEAFELLNNLDDRLQRTGLDFISNDGVSTTTAAARTALKEEQEKQLGHLTKGLNVISHVNKARVGLMTVQASTTVRNTTNGYMRNYVYALDNLGGSVGNFISATAKGVGGLANKELRESAMADVRMGVAQLKTGAQSARLKDMVLGTESTDTAALFRLMRDKKFGKNKVVQQLFREMADIGELTGSEGGFIGVARKLNYFNTMSDNMFKRAIFSREVDKSIRASPITAIDDAGKAIEIKSLDQALRTGNFKLIDDSVFANAMDEAFEFTYQTGKFKGRKGGFNTFANGVIEFGSNTLGSTVIPFPRYMINQFRFFYEHTPVLGMVNFGGILNKSGKAGEKARIVVDAETLGKNMTGLALIGAFAGVRAAFGDETTGAYEYIDPTTGSLVDARASLGPFSGFALIADLLYRYSGKGYIPKWHDNDKVSTAAGYDTREFIQAFTGGQGRAGTGLQMIDGAVNVALESSDAGLANQAFMENVAKYFGNTLGTFIVGAGVLKDAVATVDPEYRKLTDNTDVDLFEYLLKQSWKSMPQAPDEEGLPRLASPTRSGGVRRFNPFIKQITGLNPLQRRTVIERELDRMQFDYVEISPRKIRLDAPMSNEAREEMGKFVENDLFAYINSLDYKKISNDKLKRLALKKRLAAGRGIARSMMLSEDRANTRSEALRIARARFNNLNKDKRIELNERYKLKYSDVGANSIAEDEAYWFIDE